MSALRPYPGRSGTPARIPEAAIYEGQCPVCQNDSAWDIAAISGRAAEQRLPARADARALALVTSPNSRGRVLISGINYGLGLPR